MAKTNADVLRSAADDFSTLCTVFGWLDAMLASIIDNTKKEECSPESRLSRIKELADCARYLAGDWQNNADNMAEAMRDTLNAPAGVHHEH